MRISWWSSHHKIFAFHGSHEKEIRSLSIRSRWNSSGSYQELIDTWGSHGSPKEIFGLELAFLSIGTSSCRSYQELIDTWGSHGSPKEIRGAIFNDELGGVGPQGGHVLFWSMGFFISLVSFVSLIHYKEKHIKILIKLVGTPCIWNWILLTVLLLRLCTRDTENGQWKCHQEGGWNHPGGHLEWYTSGLYREVYQIDSIDLKIVGFI